MWCPKSLFGKSKVFPNKMFRKSRRPILIFGSSRSLRRSVSWLEWFPPRSTFSLSLRSTVDVLHCTLINLPPNEEKIQKDTHRLSMHFHQALSSYSRGALNHFHVNKEVQFPHQQINIYEAFKSTGGKSTRLHNSHLATISTLAVVVLVHLNAVLHFDESKCVQALSDIRGDFDEKNTGLAGTDQQVLDALKTSKEEKFLKIYTHVLMSLHPERCHYSYYYFYRT